MLALSSRLPCAAMQLLQEQQQHINAVVHAAPTPVLQPQLHRPRSRRFVAALSQGCSGTTEFGPGLGKAGSAGFGARAPAAAALGGFWNMAGMQRQLQSLGLAGVAAYGIFNTLYYICAFLFVWVYVARVPTGQGLAASAKAFAAVMAGVWAGSQVTKAPRAALALALAPLVDRLMKVLQGALGLKTKRAVFGVFVAASLSLVAVLFGAVVLAWS